jgi:ubiquitin C-terminal hydrolase
MTKYIREIFLYLPMSYNQHKRNRQDFSSNENNNDYTHNKHYKNSSYNYYYYYPRNKYGRKYEFQEESKLNYKNGYLQENYGDISGDDYITNEDYSLLIKEIEKLKNDNKNLKELKEKFEKEIQKLKNNLKEKENIENNFVHEIEKLKNDNKKIKELKEKLEKEIEKLKNNLKEKENIENKFNVENKEYNEVKNENKNIKELKEKLEKEIEKLKNNLKEKENIENKFNVENKEYNELKNENKNIKELKEKIEKEIEKLKNNLKEKENIENKFNTLNKKFDELKNENKNIKELKEKLEKEIEKLKNNLKEKENTFKTEIKNNEKLIKNMKIEKNKYESQLNEKEKEINKLNIDKEKILNVLKITKKENNSYIDEINKQKELIDNLKKQNLCYEKSLENEKKKNDDIEKLIKEKDEKILYYEKKFDQIKNIISDINFSNENKTEDKEINKNNSFNKEQNINREEEEENYNKNNIIIKNGNGKVGIINKELNCYMSSVIQILKNIKEFSEIILNIENNDDILSSLKNLIYSLFYSKKNSISITEFKSNFSKIYTRFEGRNSNDSTFFLIYLFSYLQKILPSSKKNSTNITEFSFLNLNNKELEGLKKFMEKFKSKNNSIIHDLFYHYQMSELICSGCNEAKISFQGNNVLFLPIIDGKTKLKSLEQCINSYLFTKDKKGDKDFVCSYCGRRTISHVMSLVKLSPILIINLKKLEITVFILMMLIFHLDLKLGILKN